MSMVNDHTEDYYFSSDTIEDKTALEDYYISKTGQDNK